MAFTSRKSIHGRQLAISSTGGIISAAGSTGNENSTAFNMAAQMWGKALFQTVSSHGAIISNAGITVISSNSTEGITFDIAAPVQGIHKELHIECSATGLKIETTGPAIVFHSSLGIGATVGSTVLALSSSAIGLAGNITLRGISTIKWAVTSVAGAGILWTSS